MEIQIVRRGSKEPVGAIEVCEVTGAIRLVTGPEDLQEWVNRMPDGMIVVRSKVTEDGGHVTFGRVGLPTERIYEHELCMRLQHLGYCTRGMADVLKLK